LHWDSFLELNAMTFYIRAEHLILIRRNFDKFLSSDFLNTNFFIEILSSKHLLKIFWDYFKEISKFSNKIWSFNFVIRYNWCKNSFWVFFVEKFLILPFLKIFISWIVLSNFFLFHQQKAPDKIQDFVGM
jgi:hypothetical protein